MRKIVLEGLHHPSIHSQKKMQHRRLKAENRSLDGKKLRFVFKPLASIKAVESPRKAREKKHQECVGIHTVFVILSLAAKSW